MQSSIEHPFPEIHLSANLKPDQEAQTAEVNSCEYKTELGNEIQGLVFFLL